MELNELSFFFVSLSASSNLEKVSIQLDWKYQFVFAGLIPTKKCGYLGEFGVGESVHQCTASVDSALYAAKENDRNSVKIA